MNVRAFTEAVLDCLQSLAGRAWSSRNSTSEEELQCFQQFLAALYEFDPPTLEDNPMEAEEMHALQSAFCKVCMWREGAFCLTTSTV